MLLVASIQWGYFSRASNAWEILLAFIPEAVWKLLVDGTNEFISSNFYKQYKKNRSRYRLTDKQELQALLCARMDMISSGRHDIEQSYQKALSSSVMHCVSDLPLYIDNFYLCI